MIPNGGRNSTARKGKEKQVSHVPQFKNLFLFVCFKQLMLLQMLLMPGQGQTQTVLHLLCSINMEDFRLYSFIPSLKLLLLLPVTAKGYTVSALERAARGRDSGMSGLSLPRCHFRSGPPPAPPRCRRRSPRAWPGTHGSAAAGPPSAGPGPSPSGRA